MTQPVAFSVSCYQTTIFSPYQVNSPNPMNLPSEIFSQLTEHLKKAARCIYVLGVSTLIAPCGVVYHVGQATWKKVQAYRANEQQDSQGLSARAWNHFKASEKDAFAVIRGCWASILPFSLIALSTRMLPFGIRNNNLLATAIGVASLKFGYYLTNRTHLPQAWKSLGHVNDALYQESWTKVWKDFHIDISVLAGIILEIRK